MNTAAVIATGLEIAKIGIDLLEKRTDPATAARGVAGHVVKLVPVADLRAYLDEEDRKFIDAAVDIEEEARLRGKEL